MLVYYGACGSNSHHCVGMCLYKTVGVIHVGVIPVGVIPVGVIAVREIILWVIY